MQLSTVGVFLEQVIFLTILGTEGTFSIAPKSAFNIAKQGGKHKGFLKNNLNRITDELQKGVIKLEKRIAQHQDKIANPSKNIKDWDKLDPRQQQALINKKWPSDIQR